MNEMPSTSTTFEYNRVELHEHIPTNSKHYELPTYLGVSDVVIAGAPYTELYTERTSRQTIQTSITGVPHFLRIHSIV